MKSDELDLKMLAYLDGSLSHDERTALRAELIAQGADVSELDAMDAVVRHLDTHQIPAPSSRVDDRFYSMLRRESFQSEHANGPVDTGKGHRSIFTAVQWLALAANIALLLIVTGVFLYQSAGYRTQIAGLNDEVKEVRTMLVMTLLDKESAIDRLKAVNLTSSLPRNDEAVVHALLTTLNNDPDVNVRLEAIDALMKRANDPGVRRGLVESISTQTSPLVQVTLADAMVALQEKSSASQLQKLMEQNQTNDVVREKLKQSIEVLM